MSDAMLLGRLDALRADIAKNDKAEIFIKQDLATIEICKAELTKRAVRIAELEAELEQLDAEKTSAELDADLLSAEVDSLYTELAKHEWHDFSDLGQEPQPPDGGSVECLVDTGFDTHFYAVFVWFDSHDNSNDWRHVKRWKYITPPTDT